MDLEQLKLMVLPEGLKKTEIGRERKNSSLGPKKQGIFLSFGIPPPPSENSFFFLWQ